VGEKESEPFQFTFNGFLKVAFQGSRVTSDAGLVLVRELDERLGLEAIIGKHLSDSRHRLNTQFSLPDLLRQSIYSRGRVVDQGRQTARALDPAVVSSVPGERSAAAVERARLQSRKSLAAAGAHGADRRVVTDESPTAPCQDRRALGETCPLLLATAGREPSNPPAV
jgi:hypothetical protein